MSPEPAVMCQDRAFDHLHEVVGPDAFAPAVLAGHAQINRSRALERMVAAGAELPESIGVSCGNGIVRTAERSIAVDSEISTPYQHG